MAIVNGRIRHGSAAYTFLDGLASALDHRKTISLPFEPHPGPQTLLLNTEASEVLYGGARGGGKSFGMLLDFAKHAQMWGSFARGIMFRRQFVDLDAIIDDSFRVYPLMGGEYQHQKHSWQFECGAKLKFRFLAKDRDAEKYQGHEYTWVGVEEAGTYASFDPIKKLKATMRSSHGVKTRLHLNANPGGIGHNWIKQRYIDAGPPGEVIKETDSGMSWSRIYIPSRVSDNPSLAINDPEYVMRIKQSGPEWQVRAWLDGDWNIVAGGMFDDLFAPDVYASGVIIKQIAVPDDWPIERSFDWGSSKPFSVGWWTTSNGQPVAYKHDPSQTIRLPRGSKIRIAEWYGCNQDRVDHANEGLRMLASEIACGILDREQRYFGRQIYSGVADSAIWEGAGTTGARSVADEMAQHGVTFSKSVKGAGSRASGWEVMRRMLKASATGQDAPGLFVCDNCHDWIRTVPSMPRDRINLDDIDSDAEDHASDETRYFLTTPTFVSDSGHTSSLWSRQ